MSARDLWYNQGLLWWSALSFWSTCILQHNAEISPRKIYCHLELSRHLTQQTVAILACTIPMEALTNSNTIFRKWRAVLTCCHLPFQTVFGYFNISCSRKTHFPHTPGRCTSSALRNVSCCHNEVVKRSGVLPLRKPCKRVRPLDYMQLREELRIIGEGKRRHLGVDVMRGVPVS